MEKSKEYNYEDLPMNPNPSLPNWMNKKNTEMEKSKQHTQGESVFRLVRAGDRIPDKDKRVIAFFKGRLTYVIFSGSHLYIDDMVESGEIGDACQEYADTKWFEEIILPVKLIELQKQIRELLEALKEISDRIESFGEMNTTLSEAKIKAISDEAINKATSKQ